MLDKVGVDGRQVRFFRMPTDRAWLRDTGPIFRQVPHRRRSAAPTWRFNAWAKYDDWKRDCLVAGKIAGKLALPAWSRGIRSGPWCWKAAASTSTAPDCC